MIKTVLRLFIGLNEIGRGGDSLFNLESSSDSSDSSDLFLIFLAFPLFLNIFYELYKKIKNDGYNY